MQIINIWCAVNTFIIILRNIILILRIYFLRGFVAPQAIGTTIAHRVSLKIIFLNLWLREFHYPNGHSILNFQSLLKLNACQSL